MIRPVLRVLSLEIKNICGLKLFVDVDFRFEQTIKKAKTYILTSQDFSWLQNGQLNCVSKGSMALRLVGGFLLLFLFPIFLTANQSSDIN